MSGAPTFGESGGWRTLVELHVCDCLPFVHGNKPSVSLAPAAEVDDELVLITAQRGQDSLEALAGELSRGEKVRCDDYLLSSR